MNKYKFFNIVFNSFILMCFFTFLLSKYISTYTFYNFTGESANFIPSQLSPEVIQALEGVRFIAQHIKDADKDNEVNIFSLVN